MRRHGTLAPALFLLLPAVLCAAAPARTPERALSSNVPSAERRLALVIGNDAYPGMPLKNAGNDARAMQTALEEAGFQVERLLNTTYRDLGVGVDRFIGRLRPRDVALVYYAGHGIQIEGENYLIPTDFDAADATDAKYTSYSASRLMERVASTGVDLNILILDACRNNPFRASRSAARGLAPMQGGSGSLIAFATAAGDVAADQGVGGNGLFTSFLLEALREPGLSVEEVFAATRVAVHRASGGRQVPFVTTSVIGTFYFKPPAAKPAEPTAEATLWNAIKDSTVPDLFQMYLKNYPTGPHVAAAKTRLTELQTLATKQSEVSSDNTFWESIKDSTSADLLDAYLRRFPQGAHAAEARTQRETLKSRSASAPIGSAPSSQVMLAPGLTFMGPPAGDDEEQVRQVLARYKAAFEARSAGDVRNVWPSVDRSVLDRLFAGAQSIKVTMTCGNATITAGNQARAEVSCVTVTAISRSRGDSPSALPVQQTFLFLKNGQRWMIDRLGS